MREKCAVIGVKSNKDAFDLLYYGLHSMQHRGQESAGVALRDGRVRVHKGMGLVSEVLRCDKLPGKIGIGHVRYSTMGESQIENAQPIYINYFKGSFAIAHNGQIINALELKKLLESEGSIFTTSSDTEVIAQLIAIEHIKTGKFISGIIEAMKKIRGSYSLTILSRKKLIAVRDPHGVRPLVYGSDGKTHVFASESCALDVLNVPLVRDVKPSEIMVIEGDKISSYSGPKYNHAHCMFEYVYFSRPDSVINTIPVYEVRKRLGSHLAKDDDVKADLVAPIPDSGKTTALGYALHSHIPPGETLIKNRYIGRTFILPEQSKRDLTVRLKMNPLKSEVEGKSIVLVDDSLVRGTTIKRIIKILREAGAREIHVRISCPPIRHSCPYGIDMQTSKEFIAAKKKVPQIQKKIGADSLKYATIDGLVDAIGMPKESLCMACLTGEYPIRQDQQKLTDL